MQGIYIIQNLSLIVMHILFSSYLFFYVVFIFYDFKNFIFNYSLHLIFKIFLFLKIFYSFIFRERRRKGEREGNIDLREKHCLVASCMHPDWEPNPQPRHVPWLGIKPATLHFVGWHPTNWVTPAEQHYFLLISGVLLSG